MKIQTYKDMIVAPMSCPSNPGILIRQAMDLTMKKEIQTVETLDPVSKQVLAALIKAEHTSLLEHISWTFYITGMSRSLLAQITRHRMGAFTSASQHYADYRDMPMVMSEEMTKLSETKTSLYTTSEAYEKLIDRFKVPPEEARQVLPNAAAVNLLWTVNARSLLNFFRSRMCKRNVLEMQILTSKVYYIIYNSWYEFAECCGPYCFPTGQCNQGKMTCGHPYKKENKNV